MAYSTVDDLLTGDMMISSKVDKLKFVNDAADEIDSKIGFIYSLPLSALLIHEELLLKGINNKLASGRLILTLDIAGEGTTLHAYGLRLVTEAMQELMLIANGTVDLSADLLPNPDPGVYASKTASVTNIDAMSSVEAFYDWANRKLPVAEPLLGEYIWAPGP